MTAAHGRMTPAHRRMAYGSLWRQQRRPPGVKSRMAGVAGDGRGAHGLFSKSPGYCLQGKWFADTNFIPVF
jgi:hypothetical protein